MLTSRLVYSNKCQPRTHESLSGKGARPPFDLLRSSITICRDKNSGLCQQTSVNTPHNVERRQALILLQYANAYILLVAFGTALSRSLSFYASTFRLARYDHASGQELRNKKHIRTCTCIPARQTVHEFSSSEIDVLAKCNGPVLISNVFLDVYLKNPSLMSSSADCLDECSVWLPKSKQFLTQSAFDMTMSVNVKLFQRRPSFSQDFARTQAWKDLFLLLLQLSTPPVHVDERAFAVHNSVNTTIMVGQYWPGSSPFIPPYIRHGLHHHCARITRPDMVHSDAPQQRKARSMN